MFIENKNKFVMCHCNSGHKHEIEGLFSDPNILARVTETKVKYPEANIATVDVLAMI